MKFYLSDIIPRLKKFSASLDQSALLADKPWVVSNDPSSTNSEKLIFKRDGRLYLSKNGHITDGRWDYLPEANALIIDYGNKKILYRHQFLDEAVFVLKIDSNEANSSNNYFLLANENVVASNDIESYLNKRYLNTSQGTKIPNTLTPTINEKEQNKTKEIPSYNAISWEGEDKPEVGDITKSFKDGAHVVIHDNIHYVINIKDNRVESVRIDDNSEFITLIVVLILFLSFLILFASSF